MRTGRCLDRLRTWRWWSQMEERPLCEYWTLHFPEIRCDCRQNNTRTHMGFFYSAQRGGDGSVRFFLFRAIIYILPQICKEVFQRKVDFRTGLEEKGIQKSELCERVCLRTALLENNKKNYSTMLLMFVLQHFGSIRFLSCKLSSVWNCKFRHFSLTFKAPSDGRCIEC